MDLDGSFVEKYDVVVSGGGISGSVAARFAARNGLKTLLVEKYRTPRNKVCSGVQFSYFERLIGQKIPRDRLCQNELCKVELIGPTGMTLKGKMRLLNFWRSTFDKWLNTMAVEAGAEFRDATSLTGFEKDDTEMTVTILSEGNREEVKTRYLIVANGLSSEVRRQVRPQDFEKKASGASVNYYLEGNCDLDPNTLYMFYNRQFSPLMFSWVYKKDDKWVIGTGADKDILWYANRFLSYVTKTYNLQRKIVRKEGFSSTFRGGAYLGLGNILMVGDAAGLIDFYRGMGMDNAALSGRLAVKAILKAEDNGTAATEPYKCLMRRVTNRLQSNAIKQTLRYASSEKLERSLSPMNLTKLGLLATLGNQINRILPAEQMILLPL